MKFSINIILQRFNNSVLFSFLAIIVAGTFINCTQKDNYDAKEGSNLSQMSNTKQSSQKLLGRPVIKKLGTIDCDLVETTPIVFKNKVYRYEYVRKGYKPNMTGDSYSRFVDHESGKPTSAFAKGYHLGSAFVEGDSVYVTAVDIWDGEYIVMFVSADLENWQSRQVLHLTGFGIFNTSVCKADNRYVLMYEIGKPPEEAGKRFTARFASSEDLINWKQMPKECTYSKDRYTAPHALRYLDGYFYNFYLEAFDGYETRVVRSADLIEWEASPYNPVLKASEEDKKIANTNLTSDQKMAIAEATNLNNSDIDFCEHDGKLIINYSWGNQQGTEFLAEAVFYGSLEEFLKGFYPR
jgi:alpha-L-fucosidase